MTNNGTMMIGGNLAISSPVLMNNGKMEWASGTIDVGMATIVNNGLFQIDVNNLTMIGAGLVEDYGEIYVDQGPGVALTINPNLTLRAGGTLIVQYGTTTLAGNVEDVEGGTILIATGATLNAGSRVPLKFDTGGGAAIIGHGTFVIRANETLSAAWGSTFNRVVV